MSPADPSQPSRGSDGNASVLVCGRCEEILSGRYSDRGEADQAADEHVEQAHASHEAVIVVPAPARLARAEPEELVSIAVRAQARIEENPANGPGQGGQTDERSEAVSS